MESCLLCGMHLIRPPKRMPCEPVWVLGELLTDWIVGKNEHHTNPFRDSPLPTLGHVGNFNGDLPPAVPLRLRVIFTQKEFVSQLEVAIVLAYLIPFDVVKDGLKWCGPGLELVPEEDFSVL